MMHLQSTLVGVRGAVVTWSSLRHGGNPCTGGYSENDTR